MHTTSTHAARRRSVHGFIGARQLRSAFAALLLALPLAAAASFAECPEHFPGGTPPNLAPLPKGWGLRELCYSEFALAHSAATRTPLVVVEHLTVERLKAAKNGERTERFFADARLPRAERAELRDYDKSGFDRGHMASAADMATPEGMSQSFSLANMVPQAPMNNRRTWRKIESDTRAYVKRSGSSVYVFTGPVWQGDKVETIGQGKVAVPTHLFKLVYDASKNRAWAHWLENHDKARPSKPISYTELSAKLGYELLPGRNPGP